jgi:hypothetical protein
MTTFHRFVVPSHILSITYDQVAKQDYSLKLLRHRQGPVFDIVRFGSHFHLFIILYGGETEPHIRMTYMETSAIKVIHCTTVVSDPLVPPVW